MGCIELVIKIPEEVKSRLCFEVTYPKDIQVMCEALNNGTPLPKGHGRLIDADDLLDNTCIAEIPTVIEADKAESEG